MDVTFTNVLEGARQYFQGLPAANNSTPNTAYTSNEAPPEIPPTSNAYWPQEASRPPTRPTNQYQQQQQQYPTNDQFQFSRPQSREAPSNQYQYQRVTTPTSQYHQLQNVAYYQQQQQQQQTKTYYQMQSKVATPTNNHNTTNQDPSYYKHLYNTKGVESRAGHSLPPIVSLSMIGGYHSRDVIRSTQAQKPKTVVSSSNNVRYQEDYRYVNQNRLPVVTQNYQYNYNNVVTTTTTSATYSVPATAQSSYYQPNKINQNGTIVQKRESPLDLSVKTVRTPADSTLDDDKYYKAQCYQQNYDYYNQRLVQNRVIPSASAPKVEFHPNFNVNYNKNRVCYNNTVGTTRYPTVSVPTAAHVNSYIVANQTTKREVPRMEYQPQKNLLYEMQKKRPAEPVQAVVPTKITKVDTWKQRVDQQIEQKFNIYQQQQAKNKVVNGGYQSAMVPQYQYQNQTTYVPSATAHQYPNYQYQNQYTNAQKPVGADKRVLSLLRNSLEIKTAQAQKKQEMIRFDMQRNRLDVQHPSTDVTAPVQPKASIMNRHNVSPFTPTNLPENNNIMYKLHLPKAIDSVNFDSSGDVITNHVNPNGDLDGLAALVAARIRTKAELKQVIEKAPRRRLFSRTEEEGAPNVPMRDKSGLRSSSETSVFDFTDSESEMPVLERQTLEEMRRDRRSSTKANEVKETVDDEFAMACDSFVEQLKCGSGKKRGRRKKMEAEVLAQLESVAKEKPVEGKGEDEDDVPLKSVSLGDLRVKEEKVDLVVRPAKKPTFGNGSHFYPGWEEEVYKYKKSLRMPASLIHVTRPPPFHRLSTSLPDLDPCPSPSQIFTKIKLEDSDNESNHSFKLFTNKLYDSEGASSVKNQSNLSISDRLLEKYGDKKKAKLKKKEDGLKTSKNESLKEALLKKRVSLKEVFGEDRPASAPPVTCLDIKIKEEPDDDISLSSLIKKEHDLDTKQVLKNKLLNRGRKEDNLLKSLVDRKIKSELLDDDDLDDDDSKSETPSLDDDFHHFSGKKKSKFRNIRRKFSSGFDYIRKKKKQKKDVESEAKPRSRGKFASKSPNSVQDIQKEIKGWVLNKGIGETILHRAARLGYTDITAYCLEKMECSPSPKDNAGYTPLHEASTKGNLAIARMLLMYGANVSESARGGIRPLHEAVENGFVEIVRLLLSYGADPILATYSGMTPLALSNDDTTTKLLQSHLSDIDGDPQTSWDFAGPSSCFDSKDTGFDVLADAPSPDPISDESDLEFEVSESVLPNLYTLRNEPMSDRWVLLQDLSNLLKIKSRDALLRQLCPSASSSSFNHKSVLRELKMSDFLEQAHCCQFLNIGEKVNTRASKIALVKYTDKVRELLNVESVTISVR